MTVRTMATPAQIAAFRAGQHRIAKKPAPQLFVMSHCLEHSDGYTLQLAIKTVASNAGGQFVHAWESGSEQAAEVVDALLDLPRLSSDAELRSRINEVCFTRIGPKQMDAHDNLPQSFKHVVDGWCFWVVLGEEARKYVRHFYSKRLGRMTKRLKDPSGKRIAIGKYDDQLIGQGKVSCRYDQTVHELDRRLYGIRIRFRLAPK